MNRLNAFERFIILALAIGQFVLVCFGIYEKFDHVDKRSEVNPINMQQSKEVKNEKLEREVK